MTLELKSTVPITIIGVHVPGADRETWEKDKVYDTVNAEIEKIKVKDQ